jgi:hypothetical protein
MVPIMLMGKPLYILYRWGTVQYETPALVAFEVLFVEPGLA